MDRDDVRNRLSWLGRRAAVAVVGDRTGLALLLGALVFYGLFWRIGFFITDNWTIANTMVAVSEGHLSVERIVFGPESGATPGMHAVDGRLYGRNYGQVVLSLPAFWLLEAVTAVADLRVTLAGAWSLLVLALAVQVGTLLGQRRAFTYLGGSGALVLFGANLATATALDPRWIPVIALQLTSMTAAALTGVLLYRLLSRLHDRPTGAFVGGVVVLATPIAVWASVPKRHVLTACFATLALVALAIHRSPEGATRHRALAYVAVGLTAWVHAAEGLVLLVAVLVVDAVTSPPTGRREVGTVAAAFVLSVVPFLLTNVVISGEALTPPRELPGYSGGELAGRGAGGGSAGADGGGGQTTPPPETATPESGTAPDGEATPRADDGDGGPGIVARLLGVVGALVAGLLASVGTAIDKLERLLAFDKRGIAVVLEEPSRLYHTFVRSGWVAAARQRSTAAVNLTLLESTPLFGALLAVPGVLRYVVDTRGYDHTSPRVTADAFAVVYAVLLTLTYLPRLPLHAQVTVRYLLPLVPVLGYALGRLGVVRTVLRRRGRLLVWTYAGTVLIAGQLGAVALGAAELTVGEAMQAHALLGLGLAGVLGTWAVTGTITDRLDGRIGAVLLGVTAGASTLFVLAVGLVYFPYGTYALDAVRVASGAPDLLY